MINKQWLLLLVIIAIGLGGCKKKRPCQKKKSDQMAMVDMPISKGSKNARMFEDVDAFALDDDAQPEMLIAQNDDSAPFVWQEPEESKQEVKHIVYFDYDSSKIKPDQKAPLTNNIDKMKEVADKGQTIVFKGHACRAGKASAAYNVALSNDRANKTAQVYAQAGLPKDQIKVFGIGYEEPVIFEDNPSKDGQAPNRRVEIYTVNA